MARTKLIITALLAVGACGDNNGSGVGTDAGVADAPDDGTGIASTRVYIESNDPAGNALLGFTRAADGALAFDGKPVSTGGIGITAGAMQRLGPLDSDQEIVESADGNFVYAVNAGDSTIAAFSVNTDGTLTPLPASPFPSGGANPASIGLAGNVMHVVNKAADGVAAPSYTALTVNGGVPRQATGVIATPIGSSPAIAELSPDQRFLFGTEFLDGARAAMAPVGQIDSFVRNGTTLVPAPGSPYALPPDTSGMSPPPPPVALDVIAHPTQAVLYVGFVTRSQLGVYTYDDTGALTFVRAVPNSGTAICWFRINASATRLYTVNSGSATISTYDITDPLNPVELTALPLRLAQSGPPFVDATGMTQTLTSLPFQLAFDRDQSHLYVVSQRATTNADDPTGNYLHTLTVAADGALAEPADPIDLRTLGVPPTARPQGVLVISR